MRLSIRGAVVEEIYKIRHSNLEYLLKKYESGANLGKLTEISSSYLSHVKAGRRNLGDKLARKIEINLELPSTWMDRKH